MTQTITQVLKLADEYDHNLPTAAPRGDINDRPISAWIDHTMLKPEATPSQIQQICSEAREYNFTAVCINPIFVHLVSQALSGSSVKTCIVVGFPLGAVPSQTKVFETRNAIEAGAAEIDMVIQIGMLKGEQYGPVMEDILSVVDASHSTGAIVKVILEMAMLNRREKIIACLLAQAAGADFVKTSTGFGPSGASVEDVDLMRRVVGPVEKMGIKAAGGIRSLADARAMLKAGATRLGTSAGVKIVQEALSG